MYQPIAIGIKIADNSSSNQNEIQMRCDMDFFKSSVERLLCNKNQEGLDRELAVTKEQAERIYSAYSYDFPVTGNLASPWGHWELGE